jgi:hypothetical protein
VFSVIREGEVLLAKEYPVKKGGGGGSVSVVPIGEAWNSIATSVNSRGSVSNFIFHVTGYDGPSLSDDQIFPYTGKLVCVGTYKYTTVLEAQKAVQSFKVWQPEPLTREQFAKAISSGFELVYYDESGGKTIETPIR